MSTCVKCGVANVRSMGLDDHRLVQCWTCLEQWFVCPDGMISPYGVGTCQRCVSDRVWREYTLAAANYAIAKKNLAKLPDVHCPGCGRLPDNLRGNERHCMRCRLHWHACTATPGVIKCQSTPIVCSDCAAVGGPVGRTEGSGLKCPNCASVNIASDGCRYDCHHYSCKDCVMLWHWCPTVAGKVICVRRPGGVAAGHIHCRDCADKPWCTDKP